MGPETLDNICFTTLSFPKKPKVSLNCKNLMTNLLSKKKVNRLGAIKGTEETKLHNFFEGTDWVLLRETKSPLKSTFTTIQRKKSFLMTWLDLKKQNDQLS